MYLDLYTVIVERLAALGFVNVDTALGDAQPLPSVQPFLHDDKEVKAKTPCIREVTFAAKVTVGHNVTNGAAQAEIMAMLDTVRNGFADWRPDDCVGIQGSFYVPTIKLVDFKDKGSTSYLVLLVVRVIPETFKRF